MFTSIIISVSVSLSLSSISGTELASGNLVKAKRSIVDTGVGGGGTSDFKSTCYTTPAGVDLCWGRWVG